MRFSWIIKNAVKFSQYLKNNLRIDEKKRDGLHLSNYYAMEFCQIFMASPFLTLQIVHDLSRSFSETENVGFKDRIGTVTIL